MVNYSEINKNLGPINHSNEMYEDNVLNSTDQGEVFLRTFKKDVDPRGMEWHQDGDRDIRVIKSCPKGGWGVQFVDSQPVILDKGMTLESPRCCSHRVVMKDPTEDLVLLIKENY